MQHRELALKWLNTVGKEHVQTFQDNFAAAFDISACVLTLSGETLTVWSNESLLCDYLSSREGNHCRLQRQRALQKMLQRNKTVVETCYAGLVSVYTPVYMGEEIVAAFFAGAVSAGEVAGELGRRFQVPAADMDQILQIAGLLSSILKMLSAVQNGELPQTAPATAGLLAAALMEKYHLSEREVTVVQHILAGESNKTIAEQLYISEKTVKTHIGNVFKKLQVRDRLQVALLCKELEASL